MLQAAQAAGVTRIICTPHLFHPGFNGVRLSDARIRLAELQSMTEIRLTLGGEHYLSSDFVQALTESGRDRLQIIHDTFVLVEFGPFTQPVATGNILRRLRELGLFPLIAHPERYESGKRLLHWMSVLKEQGCLFVVNARSLMGVDGRKCERAARELIDHGMIHGVASDAHLPEDLSRHLPDCRTRLEREFGSRVAKLLLVVNPWLIVQGRLPVDFADGDQLDRILSQEGFNAEESP